MFWNTLLFRQSAQVDALDLDQIGKEEKRHNLSKYEIDNSKICVQLRIWCTNYEGITNIGE